QKLLGALAQRPQLALELPAPYAQAEDTLALQTSAVDARIDARLAEQPAEQQLLQRRQQVLELLYAEAALAPALDVLQAQFTHAPEAGADASTEGSSEAPVPVFDVLAYSTHLREQLIAAEAISSSQLQNLATA